MVSSYSYGPFNRVPVGALGTMKDKVGRGDGGRC